MQKALIEMNVQLGNVLSDLSGVSGMRIIGAILKGQPDSAQLAAIVEPEVKATPEDIAKSLEGNWRDELLFVLKQQVELYRVYQDKIGELRCAFAPASGIVGVQGGPEDATDWSEVEGQERQPEGSAIRSGTELYRITGIDCVQVNGIDLLTAQTVMAEAGDDFKDLANEKQGAGTKS